MGTVTRAALALSICVAVVASLPVSMVGAQVDGGEADQVAEVPAAAALLAVPGDCPVAAPIEPGIGVDCFFDLLPDVDLNALRFAELIRGDAAWPCQVEAGLAGVDQLVCREVLADRFDEGTFVLDLWVDGEIIGEAVTITTDWESAPQAAVFSPASGEPVVFDGRPLEVVAFAYEPVDGVFLVIRSRNGDDVVETREIEIGSSFEGQDQPVDLDLPPGRYRFWPCLGPSPDECEERPGGQPFQVIDGEPLELLPGHNRRSAERINILFVGSGLERIADGDPSKHLPGLARQMLTLDGPIGARFDGELLDPPARADRLLWGPMAIEPLASHADRFNFWYLTDEVADEQALLFSGREMAGDVGFDLPNLQITALYHHPFRSASDARATSFETRVPDTVPHSTRVRFGDARVWVSQFDPMSHVQTLVHEWGHGLFGLRDEYYGFDGRPIAVGFPNCAPDRVTAEEWWGDVLGTVDPFVEQVTAMEAERLGEDLRPSGELGEQTMIQITSGGCYSDFGSVEVFRPSLDSLMNSEVPVFGPVNRQRVQEVLDRFSGRGPMTALEDLDLSCEGQRNVIRCEGELRTHLDEPFAIVAIDSVPCEFGVVPAGSEVVEPVPVTCTVTGRPTEPVELTFRSERRSVTVENLNPTVTPRSVRQPLPSAEPVPEAESAAGDGPGTSRTVAIGALLCVAAVALAYVERRRRSHDPS